MTVAEVRLWNKTVGAVSWDATKEIANFEYTPSFIKSNLQIAPFIMPLKQGISSFPALNKDTFKGLPGFLADSLPDKFGNMLIDAWLAKEGRTIQSFNPVDRLCYIGTRGMGALEFFPGQGPQAKKSHEVNVDELVRLAGEILTQRQNFNSTLHNREMALRNILSIGTSAGGARAKAVIAWNQETNEVRSGQITAPEGFSYWLLKFDGVAGNKDKDLEDPTGFGLIEYAYYKMALGAGIQMSESQILSENHRNHFMTKRFDRTAQGEKLHMQSLCALKHYDFNQAGAYSYEQALQAIRELGLPSESIEEQFRRMAFNIMGRNQDDHVKNIAFLMDKNGNWTLSPAFDVTYSYNPDGQWTARHQMTLNGKQENFNLEDFKACADNASIHKVRMLEILEEVHKAIVKWPEYAKDAGVPEKDINFIDKELSKDLVKW